MNKTNIKLQEKILLVLGWRTSINNTKLDKTMLNGWMKRYGFERNID
jgi:hypothetical protein